MTEKNKFTEDGMILLNKRKGISSFKAINELKRTICAEKIGHAGTLDPMAEGLLIVMVNGATKFSEDLMKKDKEYYVELELGYETDSYDTEGAVTLRYEGEIEISKEKISEIIFGFVGDIEQVPPMYSAIKVNGQKLYELARKGIETERKPRKVKINSIREIEINSENPKKVSFYVGVSSGTYIRTLVKDIGDKTGFYATMTKLVRTKTDKFNLEDAVDIEKIKKENENFDEFKIKKITNFKDIEYIFDYEKIITDYEKYKKLKNGMTVLFKKNKFKNAEKINENKKYKLYLRSGSVENEEFKGIVKVTKKGTDMIYIKRSNYFL